MKLKLAAGSEKCEGLKQDSLPVRFIFLIFFFLGGLWFISAA